MVSGHILPQHFLYLEVCFAFLALLTAIAFALSKAPVRLKIGVAMFALPGALHALGVVSASLRAGEGHGLAAAVRRALSQGGPALVRRGRDGAAARRACWRRCCCRRARFASGAGTFRWPSPPR